MSKRKNKSNVIQSLQSNFTLVHEQLISENKELRIQIERMTGQRNALEKLLCDRDKSIVELTEENKKLRDRIQKLEDENNVIRIEISQVKNELSEIKTSRQVTQMIKAIQDLNACDLLEKNLPPPYRPAMKLIHDRRINECHFINDKVDDAATVLSKKYVLLEFLENITIEVKLKINKLARQKDFVEQIILYLKNKPQMKPTKEDYDYARECFELI
jgi:chromosome segregation ATPase